MNILFALNFDTLHLFKLLVLVLDEEEEILEDCYTNLKQYLQP
jgi:hypothetical protein